MKNYANMNRFYIKISHKELQVTSQWLRMSSSENEDLSWEKERHPFYELQYVLDGGFLLRGEDTDYILNAGDFFILHPYEQHENTEVAEGTRKLVWGFYLEFYDKDLEQRFNEAPHMIQKDTIIMRSLVDLLFQVSDQHSYINAIQAKSLSEALFFEIMRILIPDLSKEKNKTVVVKSYKDQDLLEEMVIYIRSNYGKRFMTADEIATHFYMSKKQLYRICKELTGKSLKEILDEERLRYAMELLLTTDYTLKKISYFVGFTSQQSLVRFFKRHVDCTPGEYRWKAIRQ